MPFYYYDKCPPIEERDPVSAATHAFLRDLSGFTEDYLDEFLMQAEVDRWIAESLALIEANPGRAPFRFAEVSPKAIRDHAMSHLAGWSVADIMNYDVIDRDAE